MKAVEFEQELRADGILPSSFCVYARKLRDFLDRAAGQTSGWRGRVLKFIAPSAVKGIRQVVAFLDEFLARNCG